MKEIKNRSQVEDIYKWKITDMYSSDEIWQDEYNLILSEIPSLSKFKNKLTVDDLFDCLALRDKVSEKVSKLYVYANLKLYEDSNNTFYQELSGKADILIVKYQSEVSYIEPEILKLDEEKLRNELDNKLKLYKHYLEDVLRSKEHILSLEKEEILSQIYEIEQAPENIFSMINNADIKFDDIENEKGEKVALTHGKYSSYLENTNRNIRKQAFNSYYKSFYELKNTIAAAYNASVKKDVFNSRIRNFSSSVEASLFANNIPVEVYKNLIETVEKHLPLLHRYIKLRKKRLAVKELHFYDMYTPIVEDIDTKKKYEQAKEIVLKAVEPLGNDYVCNFEKGLNGGWIDIYENKGKRSGAYAWGSYGTHPYVSLNYDDTVNSMFTLIHEMGHAMHSYYTWSNQNYIYGDYTIFVAEVASTVNEALLMEYLLKTTEDLKQRQYLINYFMEQFRGTLFRQTMFAEFELLTHQRCEAGQALTFENLTQIYKSLNKKYYGEDIINDEQIGWEWTRIPHFYTPFYVYQYATGYSAAISLSQNILNNNGAENYIKFLKSGSSDYPINLLKLAGVDMSKTEPIVNAMAVFENLLNQMESY